MEYFEEQDYLDIQQWISHYEMEEADEEACNY